MDVGFRNQSRKKKKKKKENPVPQYPGEVCYWDEQGALTRQKGSFGSNGKNAPVPYSKDLLTTGM